MSVFPLFSHSKLSLSSPFELLSTSVVLFRFLAFRTFGGRLRIRGWVFVELLFLGFGVVIACICVLLACGIEGNSTFYSHFIMFWSVLINVFIYFNIDLLSLRIELNWKYNDWEYLGWYWGWYLISLLLNVVSFWAAFIVILSCSSCCCCCYNRISADFVLAATGRLNEIFFLCVDFCCLWLIGLNWTKLIKVCSAYCCCWFLSNLGTYWSL